MPIEHRTTLRTSKDSELIAIFGPLAFILRANGEIVVGDQVTDLRLDQGKVLVVAAPGSYTVETAIASIVLRSQNEHKGVGFYLEAQEWLTYFCADYGIAEISVKDDPLINTVTSASHHDRPVYFYRDEIRKKRIKNAPFKNHTDGELKLLGELIGHVPPFMQQE